MSYKNFPMGHGEKSVILLLCNGLSLYDDEMLAIRWHMGAWGINMNSFEDQRCYDTSRKLYPPGKHHPGRRWSSRQHPGTHRGRNG